MSKNYTIAWQGLALGEHRFGFALADDLFRLHETSPLLSGTGRAEVTLVKYSGRMELEVEVEAQVQIECDRCMDPYDQAVEFEGGVTVREGEEPTAEQGKEGANDVLWIERGAQELDLSQWLYESVVLSLPIQRVHPNRTDCNPEVTQYIQE